LKNKNNKNEKERESEKKVPLGSFVKELAE